MTSAAPPLAIQATTMNPVDTVASAKRFHPVGIAFFQMPNHEPAPSGSRLPLLLLQEQLSLQNATLCLSWCTLHILAVAHVSRNNFDPQLRTSTSFSLNC